MRINDLEFYLVEIARMGFLTPVRSLLVRLSTDSGLEGWGEAAGAWRPGELSARREALLPILTGRSIFDIEELHAIEALGNPPLRSAVETACWDLLGQAAGQPLCRLLGGEYRQRIPLAARLEGRRPAHAAQIARELSEQGFHTQIVTAVGEVELDQQLLAAVHESLGDRSNLRLDARASYTPDAARELCSQLEYDHLQVLLDPLATRELHPVLALGRQTAVPLGVWRAIRSPVDVVALARGGGVSYLVVDLEQLGGISLGRTCVAIATAAGVTVLLGGRPALGIATAAMLHFAAATPGLSGANETAYHQLRDDVLTEPLRLVNGMMLVPEAPGLGIQIDRAKLERYAVMG